MTTIDRTIGRQASLGVGTAVTDVAAFCGREMRRSLRSVDALVSSLAIPVAIMLVFVVIFGGAIEEDYVDYVVPGTLILCAGFGSAATAATVAQDMQTGVIARFKTLPIFGPAVLIGHVVMSVVRNLVACALVVMVALALGFRPTADFAGWTLGCGILVLTILAFTWLSCAVGLVLSVDAANSVTFVFLFLPYVSTGFVPVDTMPHWLQGFARHQPFSPIIEALRSALTDPSGQTGAAAPDGLTSSGWVALAWLLGILIVGITASALLYRARTAR